MSGGVPCCVECSHRRVCAHWTRLRKTVISGDFDLKLPDMMRDHLTGLARALALNCADFEERTEKIDGAKLEILTRKLDLILDSDEKVDAVLAALKELRK